MSVRRAALALLTAGLVACSPGSIWVTTAKHVEYAHRVCLSNGGMSEILVASTDNEEVTQPSGWSKETGRKIYTARVKCNNGATFIMKEIE